MENLKSPRGYFSFSTWRRIISSEVSFHSSEVSFHSSEEFFILHVDISKSPRGNHFSPTEPRFDTSPTINYCCVPASTRRDSLPTASVVVKNDTSPCRDARSVRPLSNESYSIMTLTGTDESYSIVALSGTDESYSIVALSGTDAQTERPYSSRFSESVVSKVTASSHYTSRLVRGRTLGRASRQVVTRLIPPIPPMALANSQRPTANS